MTIVKKKSDVFDYFYDDKMYTPFKQGIDTQREVYKRAMLNKDYDAAAMALKNISAEIRNKVIAKISSDAYSRIYILLLWYDSLPARYTQKTPEGNQVVYPLDIEIKVQRKLTAAYSLIIDYLARLSLI
jgi:hypothetical protein